MGSRRSAREFCLQALYLWDNCKIDSQEAWSVLVSYLEKPLGSGDDKKDHSFDLDGATLAYAQSLFNGVIAQQGRIDILLSSVSTNWKIDRMSSVDRNILRFGIFEILEKSDVPINVVINEAVEIAKKYSAEESGKFVNAILDRLKQERPQDASGPVPPGTARE